jgi:hypothetical protein
VEVRGIVEARERKCREAEESVATDGETRRNFIEPISSAKSEGEMRGRFNANCSPKMAAALVGNVVGRALYAWNSRRTV